LVGDDVDAVLQPGKLQIQIGGDLRGLVQERLAVEAAVAMTLYSAIQQASPRVAVTLIVLLCGVLAAGAYVIWPARNGNKIVGYFTPRSGCTPATRSGLSAVPVGKIESDRNRAQKM